MRNYSSLNQGEDWRERNGQIVKEDVSINFNSIVKLFQTEHLTWYIFLLGEDGDATKGY